MTCCRKSVPNVARLSLTRDRPRASSARIIASIMAVCASTSLPARVRSRRRRRFRLCQRTTAQTASASRDQNAATAATAAPTVASSSSRRRPETDRVQSGCATLHQSKFSTYMYVLTDPRPTSHPHTFLFNWSSGHPSALHCFYLKSLLTVCCAAFSTHVCLLQSWRGRVPRVTHGGCAYDYASCFIHLHCTVFLSDVQLYLYM